MERKDGMHMVPESTKKEQISTQAMGSKSREKKSVLEELTAVSDRKKCFACKELSHTLNQCNVKERLVTVAQLFGHATRFPFYMIQPSEEVVENEKFYHRCLLITSNISNLDPERVKIELNKFWKLTNDLGIRREGKYNFLASFNSEDDLISSLKTPKMEIFVDDKEVKFTVARWKEGNEEKLDLIGEWFLVYGVPRVYRNWKELYQVASAVGVLLEVDEESLEGGYGEPIRLRIALQSFDDAPFSSHFVFGLSSRLVKFMIDNKVRRTEGQRKELEEQNGEDHLVSINKELQENSDKCIEMPPEILNKELNSEISSCSTGIIASTANHMLDFKVCSDKEHKKEPKAIETVTLLKEPKFIEDLRADGEIKESSISTPAATTSNSKGTAEDSSNVEVGQSISGSSTSIIDGLFRGIQKPPIKNVYERRRDRVKKGSMEQQVASKNGMNSESSSHATRMATSTGCNVLESKSCLEKEYKELKMAETARVREGPKSIEEFGGDGENNGNKVRATAVYSKKKQTSDDTVKAEGAQSISGSSKGIIRGTHTKVSEGVDMTGMEPEGAQLDTKHVSKMNAQLTQNSKESSTHNEVYRSFSEMDLRENLLKGIYAYGLEKPSAVHQRGIVSSCKGLDVIQQLLSGTTVTLSCGVLQQLDYGSTECQALVLVPTRDLAQETEKVIRALGHSLGVKVHACFGGGTSAREEQQILSSSIQVIVGTPGRVLDILRRRALCPDHIRMFILDEADEILTGGFKDQIHDIIQLLPTKIQVGVFSATMFHDALGICRKFMNKPLTVTVPRDEEFEGISIKQFYLKVDKEDSKLDKLYDLLNTVAVTQSIIFVNTWRKVKSLTEKIRGKEHTVSASHGGMDPHARDTAIQEFRSGSSRVLIATDLRGTDAHALQVPVVINYDLPTQPVHYLRHVQQSGRSGRKVVSISFITRVDERILSDIQGFCKNQIGELPSNVADLL